MKILTVPNWSFGRDKALLRSCRDILDSSDVAVHYCESDIDHNRTVTAFSGSDVAVGECLHALAEAILPSIDLNRHMGVHPRIGGLDVCPFVALDETPTDTINEWVNRFASQIATRWEVPVYLYEKSEIGRHEADLPSLRKGGFGALAGRELHPDYGPDRGHSLLGVTVVGLRDFLIAMNADLRVPDPSIARHIAKQIRTLRSEGDVRFLGVRALGFPLASRSLSQVSLNLTLPNLTEVDAIIEWIVIEAAKNNIQFDGSELIGVIREQDMPTATRLPISPSQIV